MSTRIVSLNEDDINALEAELKKNAAKMSDDQRQFSSYLVGRAKNGKEAAPAEDAALWTWTYRF